MDLQALLYKQEYLPGEIFLLKMVKDSEDADLATN
jgi:hypothetical protein